MSAGLPLARLLEDQPDEPFTGVVAGFIPSVPGGEPTKAVVRPAYVSLPYLTVQPQLKVGPMIDGSVPVNLGNDVAVWVTSGDQAREFIRAFAYAAELLDQAAAGEPS